jgi:hypothetical protein
VSVYLGSIILAELPLTLMVRRGHSPRRDELVAQSAGPYRKIFASYSHLDRGVVEEFSEYARAMGDRYQLDVVDLRSGEQWVPALEGLIRDADVFQLFWSWNALESHYVRHEWEYALQLGRPSFVRPVYWDDPLPRRGELPPRALLDLHFESIRPRGVSVRRHDASPSPTSFSVPSIDRQPTAASPPSSVGERHSPHRLFNGRYATAVAALLALTIVAPFVYSRRASPEQPPAANVGQVPVPDSPQVTTPSTPSVLAVLVRDTDGRPRPGVTVELFDPSSGRVIRTSRTDYRGRAAFDGVTPASYQVRTASDGPNRRVVDVIVTRDPTTVELRSVPSTGRVEP